MSRAHATSRNGLRAVAFCAFASPSLLLAQAMDPNMPMDMPMPAPKSVAPAKPPVKHPAANKPAAKKPATTSAFPAPPAGQEGTDHAAMDHAAMPGMEGMEGMEGMQGVDHAMAPSAGGKLPRTPIPELTDADRAAARPPAGGHAMDASRVHSYVLVDQLEAWDASPGRGQAWRGQAWIGGDIQRLWLRSEGERVGGASRRAELEVLYGRAISPWWTALAGLRHDFDPGHAQDVAAIGIMGTAPYKYEVAATAYLGGDSGAALRLEGEYDVLLTNRLILQPHLELNASARGDAARGLGAGLDSVEAGLRLRYQVSQRVAPYIGVVREQSFGGTAGLRRAAGDEASDTRVVAGLRFWF